MAKKEKGYKSALENLIEDKGLDSAIVIEALTEALAKSYKKNYSGAESIVDCKIDDDGKIRIFTTHYVVDDVNDEDFEYSIEEAQEIDPKYQVGDEVVEEADISEFGRLAAIQTKQLLRQKIREAEKEAKAIQLKIKNLEKTISEKEDELNNLQEQLCLESIYSNPSESQRVNNEIKSLEQLIANLYDEWESLA